jgi:quercetin dioxygenase-like cupin family protein
MEEAAVRRNHTAARGRDLMEESKMNARFQPEDSTELFWFLNTLVSFPVSARKSADQVSVLDTWAAHGDSPPLHIHQTEDEIFVCLSGRLRLCLDGRDIYLEAGDTAMAPKGVPHSFRVESPEGARFLAITRGGDFEAMVRQVSRPATSASLPEMVVPSPEMQAELARVCAAHGIDLVGPPLA